MTGTALGYLLSILAAMLCGYLLGSFNGAITSVYLIKHVDVRDYGSHNAGLTNTIRCFGKGCGILTLIIDLGKGAAAMALAQGIGKLLGWAPLSEGNGRGADFRWLCYVAAMFVIVGHVYPLWHKFHGGKGVLVGVSVFLVINPLIFFTLLAIFGVILWRSRYVSLSSCIATLCVIPCTFFVELFLRGTSLGIVLFYSASAAVMSFLIVYSHRENIKRLKAGTERRVGEKRTQS